VQEQVGRGLSVNHVLRAEDPAREALVQAGQAEHVSQIVVRATRRHALRQLDRVDRLHHAVDGSELGRERLPVEGPIPLVPVRGQLPTEMGLDCGAGVSVRAPDEPLDYLSLAQRPAQLPKRLDVHLDRQALRVDQHAVAIEDHQLDRPERAGGH